VHNILVSRELGVSEEDFTHLDLLLFMKLERSLMGYRRRVATFYEGGGEAGKHNLLFTWESKADTFSQHGDPLLLKRIAQKHGRSLEQVAAELQQCKSFVQSLITSSDTGFRWVRKQVVSFYSENSL